MELKEKLQIELICKETALFGINYTIQESLENDEEDVDLFVKLIEIKIDLMDEIEKLKFLLTII